MAGNRARLAAALAAVLVIAVALFAWERSRSAEPKPALGLFTSLPLYWNESASVSEALDDAGARHWARGALEQDYRLVPLDTLDGASLARLDQLMMAQPRPLAPAENVALDDWVRGGGRLLLFADPMLTGESRFPLGDKRRPQDVVLLSPILARWGLQLTFDEAQTQTERSVPYAGVSLPERFAGRWRKIGPSAPSACEIAAAGLLARCRIGVGRVLAVADAAVLERDREAASALQALTAAAFTD